MRQDMHTPPAPTSEKPAANRTAWGILSACAAALLASCAAPVPPASAPAARAPAPAPAAPAARPPVATLPTPALISNALTPLDYRKDGARHIYSQNSNRIYKGKLPPLMHAVGVLQVDLDGRGNVRNMNWMRAPSHVPNVMREIERTVRAAAPFPAPVRLGGVTYTEVWLWDKSGNFQLDTLTEGQRSQ